MIVIDVCMYLKTNQCFQNNVLNNENILIFKNLNIFVMKFALNGLYTTL